MVFPEGAECTSDSGYLIKDPRKRRNCPLCKTELKLYEIEIKELILLCPISECLFPATEPIQIVSDESELRDNDNTQKLAKNDSKTFSEFIVAPVVPITSAPVPTSTTTGVSSTPLTSLLENKLSITQNSDAATRQIKKEKKNQKLKKKQVENKKLADEVQKYLVMMNDDVKKMKEMYDEDQRVAMLMKNPSLLNNHDDGKIGNSLLRDDEKTKLNSGPEFTVGDLNISVDPQGIQTANIQIVANARQ